MSLAATEKPTPGQDLIASLGEAVHVVTYPISVDYVQQWDLPRALAEAVSNALDADPEGARVTYDEQSQELVIEDFAEQGVGVESMVFGWSDKRGRDGVIGQFGEGLKIATIRAVSDPRIGHMLIESVGMTIVPVVAEHNSIAGLDVPVKSRQAPKVLSWHLHRSDRARGTKVRVGVDKETADAVMGRFRHITVPGYTPPADMGTVIQDEPGRVYIGGVFVTDVPDLAFGYDLSLANAKRFQNRDRTIIAGWALNQAIGQVQRSVLDPSVLAVWARRAMEGTLADAERGVITSVNDAASRRAWSQTGQLVLGDPDRYYYRESQYDSEAALQLTDTQMEEIPYRGDQRTFTTLMGLLGVSAAKVVQQKSARKQSVVWAKTTEEQDQRIAKVVGTLRAIFGEDAVGKVRVYSDALDWNKQSLCSWKGFYDPTPSGPIAVSVDVVDDEDDLWETLFHEAGHRIAHRGLLGGSSFYDYADRSRGFEEVLGKMGTMALRYFAEGRTMAEVSPPAKPIPWHEQPASGRRIIFTGRNKRGISESAYGEQVRRHVMLALQRWSDQHPEVEDSKVYAAYGKENFVKDAHVRRLAYGSMSSKINYQLIKDLCAGLDGVNAAAVWWATTGTMAMWSNRTPRSKTRAFVPGVRAEALRAMEGIESDPLYADLAPDLIRLAHGKGEPRPEFDSTDWMAPLDELVRRMVSGDSADDLRFIFAARVSIPGDPDPEVAWNRTLAAKKA